MKDEIYAAQDQEVISMVNEHARRNGRPVVGVIVPSCNVAAIEQAEEDLRKLEANELQAQRIGAAAARGALGVLCIGAMSHGLMDPGLAVLAALACCVWAAAGYWRNGHAKVHSTW